jgi:hypothetical protein
MLQEEVPKVQEVITLLSEIYISTYLIHDSYGVMITHGYIVTGAIGRNVY